MANAVNEMGGGEGILVPDYAWRNCTCTGSGESGPITAGITGSITHYCHQHGIKGLKSAKSLLLAYLLPVCILLLRSTQKVYK